ncbi:midasin-like [Plectropomus leopardus]|uniref:midasin-like n=1 Tax=Plectropomus leopardus TaxID=160734 RepID=UPI001C4AFDBF|nr:midasin-like [Plectropomus leopardus]
MNNLENGVQYVNNVLASSGNTYHGLLNQGATCYLNSVLQVLFMTKDFREAVEKHTCEKRDCMDCHLKSLFDDLKGQTAYTYKITKKLGINRVCEQQDAAEYFEKILGLTSSKASQIFHGLLTHRTKCSAGCTEKEDDGAFWSLPLPLVDFYHENYNVVNGIAEFFRDSDFSGENQMYCDECDAKSDATIKCVIKHHPDVLMLLLKRFDFNYDYMTHVKISCTVDVPYVLQIPEGQTYELYAVIEHFGSLRGGHYTATIKSQDDDKWYNFNDTMVTLLHYQPFQVDNFEKLHDAYLLFYRKKKMHAANTCPQEFGEMSTPAGFPPADSDVYDQNQDGEKKREPKEAEWVDEVSNEHAAAASINTNEETGDKDIRTRSGEIGLPSDHNVEDQGVNVSQILSKNHQEGDEERNDSYYHPQDAQVEKQRGDDDEEDMKGNAESDDQPEKRETQLEGVNDQDNDTVGQNDRQKRRRQEGHDMYNQYSDQSPKWEVSNKHARYAHPHVCVDMQEDEERVDVNRDEGGKMEGDKQSERTEEASAKHLDRDAEQHVDYRFNDFRQNMHGDHGDAQKTEHYCLKTVHVDREGDGLKTELHVKVDKEGESGARERGITSGSRKLLTKYDLCNPEFQVRGRVGEAEQKVSKVDQRCEQGSTGNYKRHEQPREDKRDVKEDKEQMRDDAQRKETSVRNPNLSADVEDKRGFDDVKQSRSQQEISVTHSTHKDIISADKQDEKKQSKGDNKHPQSKAGSSFRRQELPESRGRTESEGDEMRQETTTERHTDNTAQGRHGLKTPKTHVNTEIKETRSIEGRGKRKIKIKIVEETIQQETLVTGVRNLNLNESPLQEPQRRQTKRESETQIISLPKKKTKVSETEEAAEINHAEDKSGKHEKSRKQWWQFITCRKQHRKEKNKKKKTIGCFSFKSRKNADQTLESD